MRVYFDEPRRKMYNKCLMLLIKDKIVGKLEQEREIYLKRINKRKYFIYLFLMNMK